jgi:hypothetical protein
LVFSQGEASCIRHRPTSEGREVVLTRTAIFRFSHTRNFLPHLL